MIFIVCAGGREGGEGRTEVRGGGVRSEERYISDEWGCGGGGGGEQRQMKRKRNRLEHLFLPSWLPPHAHTTGTCGVTSGPES